MSLTTKSALFLQKITFFKNLSPNVQNYIYHKAGPLTIFFWAPTFKWGLVFAGLADLFRPVEKLSLPQSSSLACTGLIWSRYSLVIIPKNWNLFSVNIFVAAVGVMQTCRIILHKRSQPIAIAT